MDRKEKIFLYINSTEYIPLNFDELKIVLDVPNEDSDELCSILSELLSEGKIFLTKKGRYASSKTSSLYPGILHINPRGGFGFATCEGLCGDVFIPKDSLMGAIDRDKVLVRVTKSLKGKKEGIVDRILERANTVISAVITDSFCAIADNPRITSKIKLTDLGGAKADERVLIELCEYTKSGVIYARVISILGNSRDIKSLTDAIIFEHGIKTAFDSAALSMAEDLTGEIEITDGREDLTDELVFTIDGDDAKDFDDAVSLKILDNGNFELGVHIADVTHYVTPLSPLDIEAKERATSVYLTDRVIPMLPERLSNGLCSLKPNVPRLTLSVIMEIDHSGNVISHKLLKTVIRSSYRMTYNNVAKILDGDTELKAEYKDIVETLENMLVLSKILLKRRIARGSINFDFPESQIILDKTGYPAEIKRVIRNDAHRLIEEFMLCANETVAEYAFWADIPFVYRTHEAPDGEKIEAFRRFLAGFGLYMKGREVYPKDLQRILDEVVGTENETLIATYMLRSLMKAEYKSECVGHFGLAAKYYCHFTSPIRRYPDLMIHRILKDFIGGGDVSKYHNTVSEAAKHSSEKEREAELCERDTDDLFKAAYIQNFVGAVFPAKISGVTSFGIFAELENTIEGLIRLESISDDFYEYDEENRRIVGKRKGKIYMIGDSVNIEVVRSDLLSRQIDFILADNHYHKPLKSHKRRGLRNG